jgi:class 3 adenylate cyclase
MTTWPYQHLQLEWHLPYLAQPYELILEKRRLIRFDGRGAGLSEQSVSDYSLEARLLDLESVVERLGLDEFALLGSSSSGPLAIAYAARNPDRLSHLVLWNTFASYSDFMAIPQVSGLAGLMDTDWEMFTETAAHVIFGWSEGAEAQRYAAFMRECVSEKNAKAALAARQEVDVAELLPHVKTPTLIVQHRNSIPTIDIARGLASHIPNARLVVLEAGYGPAVMGPMLEFLGEGEEASPKAQSPEPGVFRTILFTDVEGSTALTDRLGDTKARDLLREHERITREALAAHGGAEVKTMGDGFMASFSSATKALECSIAIQQSFAQRNESAEEPIKVRIGLNAGEPIAEDDPGGRGDLFGTAVNMAARIAAKADAGEILASNVVRELVAGKEFLFNDRGDTELRGFEDPVRVYEVRWSE